MRRLVMWNLITLDGMFEGSTSWDLDWHEYVWGPELEQLSLAQLRSADKLLFGRVTYQGMAGYWQTATGEVAEFMNRLPKVVFSRTLDRAEWSNTRLVNADAVEATRALKTEGTGELFVFGSAGLCSGLMEHGLIDEYRLAVVPVVLGGGTALFKSRPVRVRLQLVEARPLESGCVILRYEPWRSGQGTSAPAR